MSSMRPYAAVNMPHALRDEIQLKVLVEAGAIGRKLRLADVISAALKIADQHPDEFRAVLARTGGPA